MNGVPEIKYSIQGLDELIKELEKLNKSFITPNLQMVRARKFRQFVIDRVSKGAAGLKPISSATRILTGDHDPEYLSGALVNSIEVKPVKEAKGNAADVGYFPESKNVPGRNLTFTQIAILQHTGYKIPLFGEKGKKVRAWLALNGINLFGTMGRNPESEKIDKTEKWIVVPPRPFMFNCLEEYLSEDMDGKVVQSFLNDIENQMKKGSENNVL